MKILTARDFKGGSEGGLPSSQVGHYEGVMSILELVDMALKDHWCPACGGLEVQMLGRMGDQVRFRIARAMKGRD